MASPAGGPYFLGLDASTQSLKASLLSCDLDVISECAVHFDTDLPAYGTRGGVTFGPDDGQVSSPVMMLVEAVDRLFERIKERGWETGEIRGVAAAGQQHASVYWSRQSSHLLSSVTPTLPLSAQLSQAFSRPIIPNWQDSSTTLECASLEAAVEGPEALAELTGSRAYERFTGSQIMRFRSTYPEAYAETDRISLVSSAVTTLLCLDGEVKGIDESDACGMNLWTMNRPERGWNEQVLNAIAGGESAAAKELERKLGTVETDGGRVVGRIGKWFVERYGFSEDCCVFPGTGDNPATFLSLNLRENEGMLSLGTSDVVLVSTRAYHPHQEYHAFFDPAQLPPPSKGESREHGGSEGLRYFNMIVYKNGSLARQHVRDEYFNKSWDAFNAAAEALRPSGSESESSKSNKEEAMAFWWLLPDIVPHGAHGVYKYLSDSSAGLTAESAATARRVDTFENVQQEALAILESQLLNYHSRSSSVLEPETSLLSSSTTAASPGPSDVEPARSQRGTNGSPRLSRVYATGGAAANRTILSLIADVFNTNVCKLAELPEGEKEWKDADWNACSVGVAYKARWGWERAQAGAGGKEEEAKKWIGFDTVIAECRARRKKARETAAGQARKAEAEAAAGQKQEEEGVRIVAVPGKGAGWYVDKVDWWRALEERALRDQKGGKLGLQ